MNRRSMLKWLGVAPAIAPASALDLVKPKESEPEIEEVSDEGISFACGEDFISVWSGGGCVTCVMDNGGLYRSFLDAYGK